MHQSIQKEWPTGSETWLLPIADYSGLHRDVGFDDGARTPACEGCARCSVHYDVGCADNNLCELLSVLQFEIVLASLIPLSSSIVFNSVLTTRTSAMKEKERKESHTA